MMLTKVWDEDMDERWLRFGTGEGQHLLYFQNYCGIIIGLQRSPVEGFEIYMVLSTCCTYR